MWDGDVGGWISGLTKPSLVQLHGQYYFHIYNGYLSTILFNTPMVTVTVNH
jgi:hypothetical protein